MSKKAILAALIMCSISSPKLSTDWKPMEPAYTASDIQLICRVVETETYCADIESKSHVASVVLNQYKDGRFGKSIKAVVKCPNRYAYGRKKISKSTRKAVAKAIKADTAQGAVAFHSGRKTKTFCGYKYVFTDKAGHHFYK